VVGEEFVMKNVAISEDDECWSIAESMVEEIELIREEKLEGLSANCKPKANFKGLITKRAKVARLMK
jgi:hypothetical protein